MSVGAPKTAGNYQRRKWGVLWLIIAGIIILILLLLAFCRGGDGTPVGYPSPSPTQTTTPTPPPTVTDSPSVEPPTTEPSVPTSPVGGTLSTATPVPPRGGPDTGGGSMATGGNGYLTVVGLITLLVAAVAAVYSTRRRPTRR